MCLLGASQFEWAPLLDTERHRQFYPTSGGHCLLSWTGLQAQVLIVRMVTHAPQTFQLGFWASLFSLTNPSFFFLKINVFQFFHSKCFRYFIFLLIFDFHVHLWMKIDAWGSEMERESIILNTIHQKQTTTTNSALAQLGPLIYQNILEIRSPSCLGQVSNAHPL